jgi:hypothetical protein
VTALAVDPAGSGSWVHSAATDLALSAERRFDPGRRNLAMGACICCLHRGNHHACTCSPTGGRCPGCLLCVVHCQCLARAVRRVMERFGCTVVEVDLDDAGGPFAAAGPPPAGGDTVGP